MSHGLTDKHIVLGVSGGIAAYKTPDLVRRLREQGAQVQVVLTAGGSHFITPLTLQAVSGQPVHSALLDTEAESAFGHIDLARWADLILIAPATAHCLAKLAHGLADDLLSTLCLASSAPIALAPAMNQQMWQAPAVQDNCQILRQRGVHLLGPASGSQACGEVGLGRMLEPLALVEAVSGLLHRNQRLQGRRVLVTAGPTREDLDPVRYLSNRSSGRMGYAVAQAAREAGAEVTLISGPTALTPPLGVTTRAVYSAQDMLHAVQAEITSTDIYIGTAAVADYRAAQLADQKIKKHDAQLTLVLERTPDILAQVAASQPKPFTVGFAAETQDLAHYARDKLVKKGIDLIAANQVGIPGQGFDSLDNALTLYWLEGELTLPRNDKLSLARQLIAVVAQRYQVYLAAG